MIDDLESAWQELETRDDRVDICRSYPDADGKRHWVVRLHGVGYHGKTITEAVKAALAAPPPLRRVPRPPLVLVGAHPVRRGNTWGVRESDGLTYGRFTTKRDTVAAIERMAVAYQEWHDKWAPVMAGTHGVDWLWADER